jgi:hypothetical protein
MDKVPYGYTLPVQLAETFSTATAFSILPFTETWKPSGFFLKKKPPCTIFKWQHVNRKCSGSRLRQAGDFPGMAPVSA